MEDHVRGSVLVVDDEPTITEVVARYLNRAGYAHPRRRHRPRGARRRGGAAPRPGRARPDAAGDRRARGHAPPARPGSRPRRGDPAHGQERGVRSRDRAAPRRRRLRGQAVLAGRAGGAGRRGAASVRHRQGAGGADRAERHDDRSRRASQVYVRGEEVTLTHREFDVLLFLARHPGQAFSRNQLMDAVWQYSFYTDTSTVTVHIRRLRSKIEADPGPATAHPDRVGRRLPLPAVKRSESVGWIRARAGSLSRQFALVVAIVVAPVLVALVVGDALMVVSSRGVALVAAIVVGGGPDRDRRGAQRGGRDHARRRVDPRRADGGRPRPARRDDRDLGARRAGRAGRRPPTR